MPFVKASEFKTQDRLKMLLYGNSGAGKTDLLSGASKIAIGLCEQQALRTIRRRNPDAAIWVIESSDDLRSMLAEIKQQVASGDCPFDTVALDGLTEIQQILKREILNKDGSSRESLTQGEWGVIIDRCTNIARAFRDLPLHVVVTCRAEEQYVDERRFVRPSLNGRKLPNDVAGFFNAVGYAYKKVNEQNQIIHRVLFDGVEGFLTKGDPDLDRIEIPSWRIFVRKMYGKDAPGAADDGNVRSEYERNHAPIPGAKQESVGEVEDDRSNEEENKTESKSKDKGKGKAA